jgi:hypothetical protein
MTSSLDTERYAVAMHFAPAILHDDIGPESGTVSLT